MVKSWIEVPVYHFPGYTAEKDKLPLEIMNGTNNFIRILLPEEASGSEECVLLRYKGLKRFLFNGFVFSYGS